jgi:hypothetical protein
MWRIVERKMEARGDNGALWRRHNDLLTRQRRRTDRLIPRWAEMVKQIAEFYRSPVDQHKASGRRASIGLAGDLTQNHSAQQANN